MGEQGDVVGGVTVDGRLGVLDLASGQVRASEVVDVDHGIDAAAPAEAADLLIAVASGEASLYVTSLSDPGDVTAVPLEGAAQGVPAVSPSGALLAVPTTAGVEVRRLPSLASTADPIAIDTTLATVGFGPDGELWKQGPSGIVTMAPARSSAIGDTVSQEVPRMFGLWPAVDASGAVQASEPTSTWVDLATGGEVVLAESTQDDPNQQLVAAAALADGQWARLDLSRRTFERGDSDGPAVTRPLPDDLPEELRRVWFLMRVDHGRAVVVADEFEITDNGPEAVAAWVLAFDLETGELVTRVRRTIDDERIAMARALPGGRLVVATYESTASVLGADGEVLVPATGLGVAGEHMAVSPRGQRIAMSGFADDVIVTDDGLRRQLRLTRVASRAVTLRFADEETLVTRHVDGSTNVWDLAEGRLVGRLFTSDAVQPYGFATTPDGTGVFHATPTGVVEMSLDPHVWFEAACSLAERPLEQDELDAVAPGRELLDPCGEAARTGRTSE